MYALECNNLCKNYKDLTVLNDINIKLEENKIYGFLGRNGAGKTTLLNIVAGQVFNSKGNIKVFQEEHFENPDIIKKICYVKDKMPHLTNMKVKEIFSLSKSLFPYWDEDFKTDLVSKFNLDVNKKYNTLSNGMEAMVGVIIGLSSRAPLTIYDEAYLGLDAPSRELFYEILLNDYLEYPRTIIFSTHLIDEVSNIFEEVIFLHEGKIRLHEEMDTINEKSYIISGEENLLKDKLKDKNILEIKDLGIVKKAYVYNHISMEEQKDMTNQGLSLKHMTLQELFIKLTSKYIAEEVK
ncbi:MAG: ATP-binding cassette domain-containing protein [Clostridiaceae bacterium]